MCILYFSCLYFTTLINLCYLFNIVLCLFLLLCIRMRFCYMSILESFRSDPSDEIDHPLSKSWLVDNKHVWGRKVKSLKLLKAPFTIINSIINPIKLLVFPWKKSDDKKKTKVDLDFSCHTYKKWPYTKI